MSKEINNPFIKAFLKLHEADTVITKPKLRPDDLKTTSSAPAAPAAGSSQMTVPIVKQATDAGAMATANKTPETAAANYEKMRKDFDTSTPQMKVGTTTSNLRSGSSGENVSYVQQQLKSGGFYKGDVDSKFGNLTKNAVMDYQKKYGLKVDGIVGDQTLSHMKRQSGFDKMQKENPIGAKASDTLYTQRMNSREGGGTPTPTTNTSKKINQTYPYSGATNPGTSSVKYTPSSAQSQLDLVALERKKAAEKAKAAGNQPYEQSFGESNMPSKIIEAFMKLQSKNPTDLFAEAKKAKKLDPVGKEDEDIDNDGDKDKTDSYLHNRRKKIAAAMKEERKDPYGEGIAKPGTKAPEMVPAKDKAPEVSKKSDLPKDVANRMAGERERDREIGEKGSRQRSMIDAAKDAANRGGGFRTPEAIAKGTGAMIAQPFVKAYDAVAGYEKPASKVIRNSPKSSIVMKNEEFEQLDEAAFKLTDAHKSAITKHLKNNLGKGKVTFHSEHGGHFATHSDGIQSTVHHIQMKNGKMTLSHFMTMDEEVEFSEAELEHFAAILEGPVAPTPDGHDVKAFGSSTSISGTLTDEAIAEEEKKKRGRKPGVKVGAYGPRGAKKGEGEATTNVSVPHVFHQIRTSRADSQGNYNLQHEVGGKTLNAKVSARDAAEFSKKYMNTEKPREKEAHTDAFVAKHFGVSKPKATGITLPKMPAPKS